MLYVINMKQYTKTSFHNSHLVSPLYYVCVSCWEIGLNISPTTQGNEQIYIEKNKQQRTIIKEYKNLRGNSKTGENHGPPERNYVKNYYNHTALIPHATPNNTTLSKI